MLDLTNPQGNMTVYKGITGLDYANGTYNQFQVSQINQYTGQTVVQNCYFDTTTNRLKYVMVDGMNYVFESTLGLQSRTYTDDFDPFRNCTSNNLRGNNNKQAAKEFFTFGFFTGLA